MDRKEISSFPTVIFPQPLKEIIRETHEALNYPIPYIGASLLCATAAAIGNTCRLKIKNGWIERAVMYVALVGNPGANKSHPIGFALEPMLKREVKDRLEYEEQLERNKKNGCPEKPKCRQRIVSDVTTEALCRVLKSNPAGLCLYCDELVGWFGTMDKYRKGGNDVNLWLSIFNSKPITIDRKGMDEKPMIPEPFVTVIGSIQPQIFIRQFSGQFFENGLLSRMMVIYNDEAEDMPYDTRKDIPQETYDKWGEIMDRILEYEEGYNELGPAEYTLSDEAWEAYIVWSDMKTDHMNGSEVIIMREFFQKIKNYVFRISLVLQILYEVCENRNSIGQIQGRMMILATVMGNYLLENARRTVSLLSFSSESLSPKQRELFESLPPSFSKLEANTIAAKLGISESTVDKFCKSQQGITIRKTTFGTYEKLAK